MPNFVRKKIESYIEVKPIMVIRKVLTVKECNSVIEKMDDTDVVYLEDHAYGKKADKNISAKTFILNSENSLVKEWEDKVFPTILKVNQSNFKISGLFANDSLYVAEYLKGEFRSLHMDGGYIDNDNYTTRNEILKGRFYSRKLTSVTLLSNPKDFEGGELSFPFYNYPKLKQGDMVVFPSHFLHEITKIKKGCRYSLIGFMYADHRKN